MIASPKFLPALSDKVSPASEIPAEIQHLDPGLAQVSDEQLTCMAYGHDWPRLRLNAVTPKGFHIIPNDDGTNQWVWECQECGTTRSRDTLRYGMYDELAVYSYVYPRTWVHFTADDEMSRARIKREMSRRYAMKLRGQKAKAAKGK